MGTDTAVTLSVSISIHRTSILRTSNCITGINENKCNIIYNHFVKSSTFVSGVPIVRYCAHTHIFNSTGTNLFKLHAVDIGPKMSKIYDGDEQISTPSTLGRIRVLINPTRQIPDSNLTVRSGQQVSFPTPSVLPQFAGLKWTGITNLL